MTTPQDIAGWNDPIYTPRAQAESRTVLTYLRCQVPAQEPRGRTGRQKTIETGSRPEARKVSKMRDLHAVPSVTSLTIPSAGNILRDSTCQSLQNFCSTHPSAIGQVNQTFNTQPHRISATVCSFPPLRAYFSFQSSHRDRCV